MAIENRDLSPETTLVARYKGETHTCTVVEEEGAMRFRLPDGRTFKSPSGAAHAIVDGSVNGWRFWSLADADGQPSDRPAKPERSGEPAKARKVKPTSKVVKVIKKLPNQKGAAEGETRWFCSACMEGFSAPGEARPDHCPSGHAAEATDEPGVDA